MTDLDVKFEVPSDIVGGLVKGDLVRRGGVIQGADGTPKAGRVIAWLREISTEPGSTAKSATNLGHAASILGLVGSVASVINLGATVAFGVAILRRFKAVQDQLTGVEAGMAQLAAKIDYGFLITQQKVDQVLEHLEADLLAEMHSAVKSAWTAQLLSPGDHKRDLRIEQALHTASKAAERLRALAANEVRSECTRLSGLKKDQRIKQLEKATRAVQRLRQLAIMGSLEARLYAESGQLDIADQTAQAWHTSINRETRTLLKAFLRGGSPDSFLHDELLHSSFASVMPAGRVGRWMKDFDPDLKDLEGVISFLRKQTRITAMSDKERFTAADAAVLGQFADAVDGLGEDRDRMDGLAPEFRTCQEMGLSIQGYRELLAVKDAPESVGMALLIRAG